jgi:mannose-6-phosphate isomerase
MQSLEHDERPWGCYDVLLDTDFTKVKLITVAPGKRLSYQSHEKRQEQWTLVKGELTVIRDGDEYSLDNPGESITIPCCSKHRAWNKTDKPVQFIEVQTGDYFGEDDIIRYQDDWDRGIYDHLDDLVDRKEKQLINKTDWWKKMSKNG